MIGQKVIDLWLWMIFSIIDGIKKQCNLNIDFPKKSSNTKLIIGIALTKITSIEIKKG